MYRFSAAGDRRAFRRL